jgi:hypothetical protein
MHEGLLAGDLSPARFAAYGAALREGVENMRKLVYAFYNPEFSFRAVIDRYPDAANEITLREAVLVQRRTSAAPRQGLSA